MTDKQWEEIKKKLTKDEDIEKVYRAFEGDIRVITINRETGEERRYTLGDETKGEFELALM